MEFSEIVKHQLTTTGLRKLTKFIRKEFPAKGQPHSEQMKKYEALKKLSHNDLSFGIARMVRIESSFDHSKFAGLFVLIIGSLLGAFKFMLIDNPLPLGGEVYFTFTVFAVSLIFIGVGLDKRDMTTANYFKELLEQAKADKGNEKEHPSSMTQSSNRIEVKIQTGWLFWKKDNFKQAKDLDKVFLNWSDVEIISYITSYFGYWTEKNKKAELQRIRGLNLDTIILGIARMKEIEESNDNSKIIPGFSAGLVLIATQASISYRYMKSPLWGSIGGVLLAFIFYIFVLKGIQHGRNLRSRAVKYRSLLEQVKSEMEKAS
ncbi:hypothetical protein [Bacillus haynesii]|uniref:hypothetical protein n=2 Tax=Bacillus haynesii TaxID=1925021 RepID=UPI00227EA0F8|nr:hypothetical protein [Bacillus haynesii]MCY7769524.1 hypothetical protein [Bacillus haynesii]MCY8014827.1 hypothetical protein [Bacillus haynesii]MCY8077240.1 hypothetical protein [Bacillus haynesii]MCY8350338.1 hypothetical protein [Bacillus haynesii]MCY8559936.1 hypothetical protein [Bacillus haynesii]